MSDPGTNKAQVPGEALSTKSQILETAASSLQDFTPVKHICAHLNAFHVYASEPTRYVEANHYCSHLNEGQYYSIVVLYYCSDWTVFRCSSMCAL
jgi:hypothetical protein